MSKTAPRLEDMRVFAAVARAKSFTGAARELAMPKQTVSRRVAELEHALGVQLLRRTTRAVETTDAGAVYAARCADLVKLAEDANQLVAQSHGGARGVLRVTADPLFGEIFLSPLVCAFARLHPDVRLEVLLTRRHVDLVEEGCDVAFRIGAPPESGLEVTELGPARIRYCASRGYARKRGLPERPADLSDHDCVVVAAPGQPVRWPFYRGSRRSAVTVKERLRVSSFAMARDAVRAGLGITIFPEFACESELRKGRLVAVLDRFLPEAGSVLLVRPEQRFVPERVQAFVDMAIERFGTRPWIPDARR